MFESIKETISSIVHKVWTEIKNLVKRNKKTATSVGIGFLAGILFVTATTKITLTEVIAWGTMTIINTAITAFIVLIVIAVMKAIL